MRKWIMFICLVMIQAWAEAKVVLPEILSDNMVLQQLTEVCLWGKAAPNKVIIISPSWTCLLSTSDAADE